MSICPYFTARVATRRLLGSSECVANSTLYKLARAHRWSRLEIIKKSDDQSIFAWRNHAPGLLAPTPMSFRESTKMQRIWLENPIFEPRTFSMTNRGLKIRAPMAEADDECHFMLFPCCDGECDNCSSPERQDARDWAAYNHRWLAVKLYRMSSGQWRRVSPELFHVDPRVFKLDTKPIYVVQDHL